MSLSIMRNESKENDQHVMQWGRVANQGTRLPVPAAATTAATTTTNNNKEQMFEEEVCDDKNNREWSFDDQKWWVLW